MKRYAALYKGKFIGEDDKVMSEFNEGEWVRYEDAQAEIERLKADMEKLRFDLGTKNLTAFAEGTRACCPEGYVVVPVEPTEAIKRALYKNKGFSEESVYEEILKAAQEEE